MEAVNTEQSVSLSAGNGTNSDSFDAGHCRRRQSRDAVEEQAANSPPEHHLVAHTHQGGVRVGGRGGDLITFLSTTLKASTWLLAIALLDCK